MQLRLAQSEGELSWLIYIIGQVLGSHLTPNSNAETQQFVDGELTAVVLQLLPMIDAPEPARERCLQPSNQHLQCAVLFFLQQFRKVYVGDQATASTKVYSRLQERVNIGDHFAVLGVFVNKIVANLKMRCECRKVNDKTLALFADLASGYCSSKLLLKLDSIRCVVQSSSWLQPPSTEPLSALSATAITRRIACARLTQLFPAPRACRYMLLHHTAEEFPFLLVSENMRLRTTFYGTLCKLLFLDDIGVKFKQFMEPFTQWLRSLASQSENAFREGHVRTALIGLLRDLRGIVCACSNRRTYGLFFDWLYPEFTPLMHRTVFTFHDSPELTTPLLKLYAELVYNKAQVRCPYPLRRSLPFHPRQSFPSHPGLTIPAHAYARVYACIPSDRSLRSGSRSIPRHPTASCSSAMRRL